jgi:glycosyltransferase involved in cell wall biosynthesis
MQTVPGKVYYFEHDRHENRGTSATRNLGIKNATGKYRTIDSDDIWVPNKLQEQVNILDRDSEIGMVYGDTKHWYS